MTAKSQKKNIRRLRRLQIRAIIRDSRSWRTSRTCFNHPLLQQTPSCLLFPNNPENYVTPFPISWHVFITTQKTTKKHQTTVILNLKFIKFTSQYKTQKLKQTHLSNSLNLQTHLSNSLNSHTHFSNSNKNEKFRIKIWFLNGFESDKLWRNSRNKRVLLLCKDTSSNNVKTKEEYDTT
jgi:hypothetical protein